MYKDGKAKNKKEMNDKEQQKLERGKAFYLIFIFFFSFSFLTGHASCLIVRMDVEGLISLYTYSN